MKINKTASVKMQWDTFTFPIKVGTPVSANGVLANNASAYGLVVRTVNQKPDADELLYVMTDGIIDMEDIVAGFGTALSQDAINALGGIHVFSEGAHVDTNGVLNGLFMVKTYTSADKEVSAGSDYSLGKTDFNFSIPEGYSVVGFTRASVNNGNATIRMINIDEVNAIISGKNTSPGKITINGTIKVLFVKTHCIVSGDD